MREGQARSEGELEIRLLGGFEVVVSGSLIPPEQWKMRKVRALVKLLALAPGHRVRRDEIIETLWPESEPESGANAFYQALHNARQVLARGEGKEGLLPALKDGSLQLSPGWDVRVDVEEFESAANALRGSADPAAYQQALSLYRGDLLPDDPYEDWAAARRESLRATYLSLLLDLARLSESRAEYQQGIDTLLRLLAADRSNEEAHAGLMRLYVLTGQRQQALRQYQALRTALREELDAEPSEDIRQLYEAIQAGRPVGVAVTTTSKEPPLPGKTSSLETPPAPLPRYNLPYRVSTFIGREQEIDRVIALLRGTRLLTVTGAGGVGKTSLAIRAAEYLLPSFPEGVWLVELASLSDPALTAQTCSQALGVIEMPGGSIQQQLTSYLAKKRLLLVLDNCEHLLAACAALAQSLLSACPGLAILATSREPLGLSGETIYRLPSLAVPEAGDILPLEALAQVESVRLFVERAAQVSPGFILLETNAGAVGEVCRRLDGIPLAIELAAARVRMMNADQIAARLDDAFQLLARGSQVALPRQQTLKATIDWSYDLLASKERLLFQRLSVFSGGWNLEAAEAVAADEDQPGIAGERIESLEVLDLLGRLIDKSLVQVETGQQNPRYRLLETIRQYASERLREGGDSPPIRDRHLAYYARLTGEAEPHLRGQGQVEWLARLDDELDNLRAALEWSRTGQIEKGLQIAADLMYYWHIRGMFHEEMDWLTLLLANEVQGRAEAILTGERAVQRARTLRAFAYESGYVSGVTQAERESIIQESIMLLRSAGVPCRRELGISLFILLSFQGLLNDPSPSRDEMLAILHQERAEFYLSEYYFVLSGELNSRGELDLAESYNETSLAICKKIEDIDGIASRIYSLGFFAVWAGKYQEAETLFQEAMALSQKVGNRWLATRGKAGFLMVAIAQGDWENVRRLGEECLATYRELNYLHGNVELLLFLIRSAWSQGDYSQVAAYARQIAEGYPDNTLMEQESAAYQGRAALSQNDIVSAQALLKKAIRMVSENQILMERVSLLLGWASLFMKQGQAESAARLLGALDTIYRRAPGLGPRERSEHDEALEAARASLGEVAFTQAWQAGQALTLDQAIDICRMEEK